MSGRLAEKEQPLFTWKQGGNGDPTEPTYCFQLEQRIEKKKPFIDFVNLCKRRNETDLFGITIVFTDFIEKHMKKFEDWVESERSEVAKKRVELLKRGYDEPGELEEYLHSQQLVINRDVRCASFNQFMTEFMSVLNERIDGKLDKELIRFELSNRGSILDIPAPGATAMEMLATIHQFYPFDLAAQKTIVAYLLPSVELKSSNTEVSQCRDVTSFFSAPGIPRTPGDIAAILKTAYSSPGSTR